MFQHRRSSCRVGWARALHQPSAVGPVVLAGSLAVGWATVLRWTIFRSREDWVTASLFR